MPDYLSRYPLQTKTIAEVCCISTSNSQKNLEKVEVERLKSEQKKDHKLNTLYEAIKKPQETDAKTKKRSARILLRRWTPVEKVS